MGTSLHTSTAKKTCLFKNYQHEQINITTVAIKFCIIIFLAKFVFKLK